MWFFSKKASVPPQNGTLTIRFLWNCKDETLWKKAHAHYYEILKREQAILDRRMETLNRANVQKLPIEKFYAFLHDEYFVWKYTQKNWLASNLKNLEQYTTENRMHELEAIRQDLFRANHSNVQECLRIVTRIRGLGVAGGSGLLSILFPEDFGVLDQFVVKSLLKVDSLPEHTILEAMNPKLLTKKDGVVLTTILRRKAKELNATFHTNFWTPRKLDMILWSIER